MEFTQASRFDSAVAIIEDSVRLRALCRARLLDARASLQEQTAAAAKLVEETRALLSSLRRTAPKEKEPIGRRGDEPRKDVASCTLPVRSSIDSDWRRPAPAPVFSKCGPTQALARITASIAALALGEQYNQVLSASVKGQPLDASVVRQKLRQIAQLLDAGRRRSC